MYCPINIVDPLSGVYTCLLFIEPILYEPILSELICGEASHNNGSAKQSAHNIFADYATTLASVDSYTCGKYRWKAY